MNLDDCLKIVLLAGYIWLCLFTTTGHKLAEVNIALSLAFCIYVPVRFITALF